MKLRKWAGHTVFMVALVGCGSDTLSTSQSTTSASSPDNSSEPGAAAVHLKVIPVAGNATFGSQCPQGYIAPPQPSPIQFVSAPTSLRALELNDSLNPLIIQADCKKYTLDVRGMSHTAPATTWEFPPSGNVEITVDGGQIQIKNDGAGNQNCFTPALVEIRGKINCDDVDFPTIQVQVFWNLGKTPKDLSPGPTPSPTPSGSPTPLPSPSLSPTPSPAPTSIVAPPAAWAPPPAYSWPAPGFFPTRPRVNRVSLNDPETRPTQCQLPEDAYLQTPSPIIIKQCSY